MGFTIEDTFDAPGVDVADVFAGYEDPATWPRWGHNTSRATARSEMATGTIVDVKVRTYPWTYAVSIREFDPGHRLVLEVRPFGVTLVQTYEVERIAGGTRIRHAIAVEGPLSGGYGLLAGAYTRQLSRETRAIAAWAAARP